MEYTEQQKAMFKEQFRTRRARQLILAVLLVVLMVAFAVLREDRSGTIVGVPVGVVGPVFLVLVAGALVFSLKNWRCPACDRYLGRGINPRFCQKCGVALQ